MNTDKHLLLIGSQYPESTKQELLKIADELGMKILPTNIGSFKSGERYCELYPNMQHLFAENQEEIAGAKVHVVMSVEEDPNLAFVDAINIAETVTDYGGDMDLTLTFAPYGRQDRYFENRMVSVMAKTFAKHLHYAGVKKIVTFDVHSKAAEKFYTDYFGEENAHFLSANALFAEAIKNDPAFAAYPSKEGAPDGADKPDDVAQRQAQDFSRLIHGSESNLKDNMFGIIKRHTGENTTEIVQSEGDVHGCATRTRDDMIDTAGTVKNAAVEMKENGAEINEVVGTHAICSGDSLYRLTSKEIDGKKNPIDHTWTTDSILSIRDKVVALPIEQQNRITVLSTIPLVRQSLLILAA